MTNTPVDNVQSPWSDLSLADWLLIFASACVVCVIALGVHDVMLTKLRVPYPSTAAVPNWAKYIDITTRVASLVWLARIASPFLGRLTLMRAATLLGVTLMCLNETLRVLCIYISLTRGWEHDRWAFTIVDRFPYALIWFLYGAVAVVIARQTQHKNLASNMEAAVVVRTAGATVAAGMFALQPMLEKLAIHIEHIVQLPDPMQVYFVPYPLQVDWVIYGTFVKATSAAFVLVTLLWPCLKGPSSSRICKYAMLLLLVRGRFLSMLLFSFYVPEPRGLAFLSESQFLLETLLLGTLWGVVCTIVGSSRKVRMILE